MLQSITEFSCLINQMIRNTDAETIEHYEIINKLLKSCRFRNILTPLVNQISRFRYIPVFSLHVYFLRSRSRSSEYDNLPSNFLPEITKLVYTHFYSYILYDSHLSIRKQGV